MSEFTSADLRNVIYATVGVEDSVDLDGDIMDTPFGDLGYDSLALLEIANKIDKEYGVSIPDEMLVQLDTPRHIVDFVNGKRVGQS